jgi:phenylacetate-CoA ligase
MKQGLLRIYHQLPAPARSIVASAQGRYLSWWRYGKETDSIISEALSRESWSPERLRAWQEERMAEMLHFAATQVPYYRKLWAGRRLRGDKRSWECLENWPVLEKEPLRREPLAFVADTYSTNKLFHLNTSGTTGKSLDLWFDRRSIRLLWGLSEARWRRWYGVSREDRWAIIGGQLVTPVAQRRPPFWVWNSALHQLYMSSYHLAPDLVPHYLDALAQHRVVYIRGYSSSLNALAQEALRLGRRDIRLKVAISNAEPLLDFQRETIEQAFQCPVRETYGMGESVAAASECEAGRLHLWPEAGWVEVLDGEELPVPHGCSGNLVCTGLINSAMPLIRYRVGDSGALRDDGSCACGRTLQQLAYDEGRSDDLQYTRDGRRVGRLDPVFKASMPIREAQIVQETLDRVRVRIVYAPGYTTDTGRQISEQLRARMGDVEVELEQVAEIPRGANGKFRAVVCQVAPEQLPS